MTAPVRQLGYRLFGRRLDYLLHLRPAEWPIVAVHAATGAVLAVSLPGLEQFDLRQVLLGIGLWVVCLNGGTLAVNSAFDHDEGDIAYLRAPPDPPPHLFTFGTALMVFGLGAAAALPALYWQAYASCMGLSILYSVPPIRLKSVAGIDWFINMWGFGTLTPFAGWAASGLPISRAGEIVLLGFCPLFAGLYPLTQLYQADEDRRRGDRTLASVLGPRASLVLSFWAVALAFGLFGWAGLEAGWMDQPDGLLRLGLLLAGAVTWGLVLLPWLKHATQLTPRSHQRRMYAALVAWAVTDGAVIYGFGR
ncbi:MAG TPA: UbiA family prenyltransferase [Gemmatimonadales bacterium]